MIYDDLKFCFMLKWVIIQVSDNRTRKLNAVSQCICDMGGRACKQARILDNFPNVPTCAEAS